MLFIQQTPTTSGKSTGAQVQSDIPEQKEKAIESLTDPITRSPSHGKLVSGIICLHVDDLFCVGDKDFLHHVVSAIQKDYQIGSEDTHDVLFVGQGVRWKTENNMACIQVDQERGIEELGEIDFDKKLLDTDYCQPYLHTQYRSVLGQANWLQSRTQYTACYRFSRCASAAANPTIADVKQLDKLVINPF